MQDLKDQIENDLDKAVISSMVLFDRFNFLDPNSKTSGVYFDSRYIPFYYHLGKRLICKNLLHIGFGLGLQSGVFLMGCPTVECFLGFQNPRGEYYSTRLGKKNIRSKYKKEAAYYVGHIQDDAFEPKINKCLWESVILTEITAYDQMRITLDVVWEHMEQGGSLIVDHLSAENVRKSFSDFCKTANRIPIIIKTRYETAIIEK